MNIVGRPLCGDDGVTYSNQCALEREECRTKRKINVDHNGECCLSSQFRCNDGTCISLREDVLANIIKICQIQYSSLKHYVFTSFRSLRCNGVSNCKDSTDEVGCLTTNVPISSRQSPSENYLCQSASCGTNAVCEAKENEALCKCPNGYSGDGKTGCRPDKICYNRSCGTNAICEEIDHRLNCKCPQGYVGNPLLKCQEGTEESDSDKLREALIEAKCPENKNLPLGRSHSR